MRPTSPSLFPLRYSSFALCVAGLVASAVAVALWPSAWPAWLALLVFAGLSGTGVHDLRQTRHAILRNYPVIGHMRFLLEFIRPEIRHLALCVRKLSTELACGCDDRMLTINAQR